MIIKHLASQWSGTVFFKQPPMKRIVNVKSHHKIGIFHYNGKCLKTGKYFLSMPSLLFKLNYYKIPNRLDGGKGDFILLTDSYVSFVEKNNVYKAPLLNVDHDGLICLGSGTVSGKDIEELIKETLKRFWTYEFNEGFRESWLKYENILCDYEEWQKKTKENPEWIPEENLLIKLGNNYFKEVLQNDN